MQIQKSKKLTDVRHITLCYSRNRYCGHPRQSGIFNYGDGEIAVLHSHASSLYKEITDVDHSFTTGYASRAKILLQRSLDNGETWPEENNIVIWDESLTLDQKRTILYQAEEPGVINDTKPIREEIDLTSNDAAIYFARTATGQNGPDGYPTLECFAFRSKNRGYTWEDIPTRVHNPILGKGSIVHRDAHPLIKFPDGTLMGAMSFYDANKDETEHLGMGGLAAYATDDNGLNWNYISEIARDSSGFGRPTYANIILLPSGKLQCYMLNQGMSAYNIIQSNYSDDGGYSWSKPIPIVKGGNSPWTIPPKQVTSSNTWWYGPGIYYRSPWPLQLKDGRIIVLFARRTRPSGIGLIMSEDNGKTWSSEIVLREDGGGSDLGYPVATELEDGRIFTAYYFMKNDGNNFGGTRYIAGSFFELPN